MRRCEAEREQQRQAIVDDGLGNDEFIWAFSPEGTYALSVHSGLVS
ncbi:hypothetical protein NDA00_29260 [Funiculus sociatus GB2-M2]